MAQPVVTRTQRRIERKQVVLIVFLILAVAGGSFALGVLFGQRGGSLPGLAFNTETPKLPMVIQVAPPQPPASTPEAPAEKQDKLTFYENLPKGNQAPLGSGINLPPEEQKPVTAGRTKDVPKTAVLPSAPPEKLPAIVAAPSATPFVVQVASFRTRADAEKLAGHLKAYQLKTYVEEADLGKKGVWHRVLAGPFANRESADQAAGLLREKERLAAIVRQR
jgi:cell division septation protein DedD